MNTDARAQTVNLGAGPSMLPTDVLMEAAQGIIDYGGAGIGVTELSHRSSTFKNLIMQAENDLRTLLDIPSEYAILFLQGGGTEQFSATLLNMLAAHASKHNGQGGAPPVDYVVSGSWSGKAYKEARRLYEPVRQVVDLRKNIGDATQPIPAPSTWNLSSVDENPAMLYYCDNETIDGFEFTQDFIQQLPEEYRQRVPIVADCSSNILSRPVDIRSHAVVFFGAQKNVGPSGVTIVIVRRDLVVDPDAVQQSYYPRIPTTMVYKNAMDNGSLYNTPPIFPIYVSGLGFRKLVEEGGVARAQERAHARAKLVYDKLEQHPDVFKPTVAHADFRSQMNLTFRILDANTREPSESEEARFVKLCEENKVVQVKGHRSVGGIRISLYNASTLEMAQKVVSLMDQFIKE
ncbi:phosphoserine transaminase [Malassezia caprae]|uniref:phosphoserine transaminase n=1 Tax=Malassezia caprae TaxID=1381934 RepID=A0AAF0J162_9BASI|nr:phosphoserine transaminase [Malassezia caprae]